MKTEVMQLELWWTTGNETWSVQLDSNSSHNVRVISLCTRTTLTASVATIASATWHYYSCVCIVIIM